MHEMVTEICDLYILQHLLVKSKWKICNKMIGAHRVDNGPIESLSFKNVLFNLRPRNRSIDTPHS